MFVSERGNNKIRVINMDNVRPLLSVIQGNKHVV